MIRRVSDITCVFRIHLARLRREAGPFLLAAVVFPLVMYMFANAVGTTGAGVPQDAAQRLDNRAGCTSMAGAKRQGEHENARRAGTAHQSSRHRMTRNPIASVTVAMIASVTRSAPTPWPPSSVVCTPRAA